MDYVSILRIINVKHRPKFNMVVKHCFFYKCLTCKKLHMSCILQYKFVLSKFSDMHLVMRLCMQKIFSTLSLGQSKKIGWDIATTKQSSFISRWLATRDVHYETLRDSGIFRNLIQIQFQNNLLGAKWTDRAEVYNTDEQSHNLLISLLHHYTMLWACWVFPSFSYWAQIVSIQHLLKLFVSPTLQFFMFI